MVPIYLLQEEASRFPVYVDNSEFNNDHNGYKISIKIKISSSVLQACRNEQIRTL